MVVIRVLLHEEVEDVTLGGNAGATGRKLYAMGIVRVTCVAWTLKHEGVVKHGYAKQAHAHGSIPCRAWKFARHVSRLQGGSFRLTRKNFRTWLLLGWAFGSSTKPYNQFNRSIP